MEQRLTAAGLWEAVIMHPMTFPSSFLERRAAKIPVRKMTESRRSALATHENEHEVRRHEHVHLLVGEYGKKERREITEIARSCLYSLAPER